MVKTGGFSACVGPEEHGPCEGMCLSGCGGWRGGGFGGDGLQQVSVRQRSGFSRGGSSLSGRRAVLEKMKLRV